MMNTSRRVFMGTIAAGIPIAAFGVKRGFAFAQAPAAADTMGAAIVGELRRNHLDLKQRGPHGEHYRTLAANLRLLTAHQGKGGTYDRAIADGLGRRIDTYGRDDFYNFDFAGHARNMIKTHLGEDVAVTDGPTRKQIVKVTSEMLAVGITPLIGRIAKACDVHSHKLDLLVGDANRAQLRHVQQDCESDAFDEPGCDDNGGGPDPVCGQLASTRNALEFAVAATCNPWALLIPGDAEICMAASIGLADIIMLQWAFSC